MTMFDRDKPKESVSASVPGTMKWHGWGIDAESFDPHERPYVWDYAARHLGIVRDQAIRSPVALADIAIPARKTNEGFERALADIIPAKRVSTLDYDRLLHAYGKSTRDLWRLRLGRLDYAPDWVIFPESEEDVTRLLVAAAAAGVAVVPFGGGTNVAGCVEVRANERRPVAAINLRLMNRIIDVDPVAGTARVQPGLLGPDLEKGLSRHGFTLGHFPDSFLYSTVGGWVASRSSGMMSDGYGNIEDMVVALNLAAPSGLIRTRAVPRTSNGPDIRSLMIGSEGALGIITELTVAVRRLPEQREFRAYLFPSFEAGVTALRECRAANISPDLARLNDPQKTQLSAAFRRADSAVGRIKSAAAKLYLRRVKKFDLDAGCLMIVGIDGSAAECRRRRIAIERVYKRHGAIPLGRGPGNAFAEGKYDFPHIRDFMFNYDVICDVAETSTTWSRIDDTYNRVRSALREALADGGHRYWLGCHVSHTYASGAALYFTFASQCRPGPGGGIDNEAELQYYLRVKKAALDAFQACGATLSHHHSVGFEHLPWLAGEAGLGAATAVDILKPALDSHDIMNPGKLRAAPRGRAWNE